MPFEKMNQQCNPCQHIITSLYDMLALKKLRKKVRQLPRVSKDDLLSELRHRQYGKPHPSRDWWTKILYR